MKSFVILLVLVSGCHDAPNNWTKLVNAPRVTVSNTVGDTAYTVELLKGPFTRDPSKPLAMPADSEHVGDTVYQYAYDGLDIGKPDELPLPLIFIGKISNHQTLAQAIAAELEPMLSARESERPKTADLGFEQTSLRFRNQDDGFVFSFSVVAGDAHSYYVRAQRFVGAAALTCQATVRSEPADDERVRMILLPMIEQACFSLEAHG